MKTARNFFALRQCATRRNNLFEAIFDVVESGLCSSLRRVFLGRSAGSFPEQRLVIKPIYETGINSKALFNISRCLVLCY